MASAAAKRIRAELFGSQPTSDKFVSNLDYIPELRASEARYGEEAKSPSGASVARSNVAGLAADWITSSGRNSPVATILYLHGGGFISGCCALYRNLTSHLAITSHSQVIVPEYRLAPEHPFPASLQDVIAVYKDLIFGGIDPRRLVVMGDSAGGGLCAALLLAIRDGGGQLPIGAVLISPWLDLTLSGDSYRTRAKLDPVDRLPVLRRMAKLYLADSDPTLPTASPLFGDLSGFPRTLIQVGDHEVMLDDSKRFCERVRAKGGHVRMEIWPEMWHGWHMSIPDLPEARKAIRNVSAFVQNVTSA